MQTDRPDWASINARVNNEQSDACDWHGHVKRAASDQKEAAVGRHHVITSKPRDPPFVGSHLGLNRKTNTGHAPPSRRVVTSMSAFNDLLRGAEFIQMSRRLRDGRRSTVGVVRYSSSFVGSETKDASV